MKKYIAFVSLILSVKFMAQVGIMTQKPEATLDVNGNVTLEETPVLSSDETTTYRLLINNANRRLSTLKGTNKVYSNVSYTITTQDNSDWVAEANTGVPTSQYTGILLSAYFGNSVYDEKNPKDGNYQYGIKHYSYGNDTLGNVAQTAEIKSKNGYWYLSADYDGVDPYFGYVSGNEAKSKEGQQGFYWKFDVLFINNGFIDDLGTYEDSVDGSTASGSFAEAGSTNLLEYLKSKKL